MQFFKKYWPTITATLGAVIPFLMPSILEYVKVHPHTTVGVLLAAAVAAYHSTAPKDQADNSQQQSQGGARQLLVIVGLVLCFSAHSFAQVPANIYAGGISFNNAGSPSIAGTGLYARSISGSGTYAFTVVDALPTNLKPFTVTTNFGGGIAQKLFTIGKVPIFLPSSAGVSYNGSNTGWVWSTGALASITVKKNWRIFPTVRIAKSSVSNGTGYQPIVGILFGWGQ